MAKRRRRTDPQKIEQHLDEGRGQGQGIDYQPWLRIQDVPSLGLATRIKGWKTGREHHFMSQLETHFFYILEWSLSVIDIREQFPLLPLETTQKIAEQCGFVHPRNPQTKQPIVMTTDFLITLRSREGKIEKACAIKSTADLQSERTLKKLEIERQYWEQRNVSWGVITEQEIPKNLVKNLEWVHCRYFLEDLAPLELHDIKRIEKVLIPQILESKYTLANLTNACDDQLSLARGTSLSVVRYLIANRHWLVDMNQPIQPRHRLILLGTTSTEIYPDVGGVG